MSLARRLLRRFAKYVGLVLWVAVALDVVACGGAVTPTKQPTEQNAAAVTVRELTDHSVEYGDRTVSVTGTIVVECPEGCWFFLDDGTGKLYIDLKPAELTIPQKIGSRVTLSGKITGSGGNLKFLGENVRFLDEK